MSIDQTPTGSAPRRWLRIRGGTTLPQAGEGTAWIVFDAGGDLYRYHCYWLGGRQGDHLLERGRATTAADAVAWAADRTPRARIRLPDHRTYWAGTGSNPGGYAGTWQPARRVSDDAVAEVMVDPPASTRSEPSLLPARQKVGARS